MSDFVLNASLALQWFLEDEENRKYSLAVLASLSEKRTLVPLLWFYEVGNGLLMACRRKRISLDQVDGFLTRLKALPIEAAQQTISEILELPALAQAHGHSDLLNRCQDSVVLNVTGLSGPRFASYPIRSAET